MENMDKPRAHILPHPLQPDVEALAHSERLRAHINGVLRAEGGWLSFSRFMALCLYAPGLGYYSAGAAKFGPEGDFVTAPEMTPMFARTLARPVAAALKPFLDSGKKSVVFELGAGSGRLARDLLLALERHQCLPDHYWILEVSPDLRERQQATLSVLPQVLRARVRWLDTWPESWAGVLVANEVLDAMPVHKVGRRESGWVEWGVVEQDSGWQLAERPLADDRLRESLPEIAGWSVPYDTEVNLAGRDLMTTLARTLESGKAFFIDYGFPAREYYHPQRSMGTIMCHFRHRAHTDPLLYPGLQDITAHVDFTAIGQAALDQGLAVLGYDSQARWLLKSGLLGELENMAWNTERERFSGLSAIQKLLAPQEMGELFKVLVVGTGLSDPGACLALGCSFSPG